jgi:hypothetical protein
MREGVINVIEICMLLILIIFWPLVILSNWLWWGIEVYGEAFDRVLTRLSK